MQDLVESALEGAAAAAVVQDPLLACLLILAALAALYNRAELAEQAEQARTRAAALVRSLVARASLLLLGRDVLPLTAEEVLRRCVMQGEEAVQTAWGTPTARKAST